MFLAALLLPRVVTPSLGCGPDAGSEGGPCIKSHSCKEDDYCNWGLVCTTAGTCVQGPQQPTTQPTLSPCDNLQAHTSCPAGFTPQCLQQPAPDPAWNGACAAAASDSQGNTLFCCDTSKSMCWTWSGDISAPPTLANEVVSGCPGGEFSCHDLSAPPIADASIQCASYLPNDAGWAATCCVSGSRCFAMLADGYYPQGQCAPGEDEYFCTGTATLGGGNPCRPVPAPDGGEPPAQAPAFCCPSNYVPSVSYEDAGSSDGGLDAEASD